jgi:hypothetical protein
MRKRTMAFVVLVTAALAIPATLVFAGNGADTNGEADFFNTNVEDTVSTNSNEWKPIPGMFVGLIDATQTATISAEMKQGKAKIRLFDTDAQQVVVPGPVTFTAKASNSFSFGVPDNCPPDLVFQWKRVGGKRAIASNLSLQRVSQSGPCF